MGWRKAPGSRFVFALAVVLIPAASLALECKPKTAGYFQQLNAKAQAGSTPQSLPGLAKSLTGVIGDPSRGRAIVQDPRKGNCTMCHRIPALGDEAGHGSVGPNLNDVGVRFSEEQLRQRIVNPKVMAPNTIMPAFQTALTYDRTPPGLAGTTILSPAEVEDVVAFLKSQK